MYLTVLTLFAGFRFLRITQPAAVPRKLFFAHASIRECPLSGREPAMNRDAGFVPCEVGPHGKDASDMGFSRRRGHGRNSAGWNGLTNILVTSQP